MSTRLISGVVCALALALAIPRWRSKRSSPLPPGPTGLPHIGNILQIDPEKPYLTFRKWRRRYGDIFFCRVWGQNTIVVSSEKIARELLDKRSSNYSDKMLVAESKAYSLDFNTAWLPYTDTWRFHRRIYHLSLRQEVVPKYRPMQLRRAYKVIEDLLEDPEGFEEHLQAHSAAIVMSVLYGYETASKKDPMVSMIETANDYIIPFGTPASMGIVKAFPFLLSIPTWLPGGKFRQAVMDGKKQVKEMLEVPYQYVVKSMKMGIAPTSMTADMLQWSEGKDDVPDDFEECLMNAGGTAFQAGADTTFTTLQGFVYRMVTNPEAQKRAQAQIDAVVGTDRLPDFEDRESLPLIEAIVRETIRAMPTVPVNLPHGVTNDDIYEGYFIPKGAIVLVSTWEILHDETRYPEPMAFKPERFLNADGSIGDDMCHLMTFGFGRRLCPGRHFALASVWSAVACMLATFNFEKAKDAQGRDIEPNPRWTPGLTSRPTDFPCRITPRFPGTAERVARARVLL